jgi:hypothetical protein
MIAVTDVDTAAPAKEGSAAAADDDDDDAAAAARLSSAISFCQTSYKHT